MWVYEDIPRIHDLLGSLDLDDARVFKRKFGTDGDAENYHTLRELVLGLHLRQRGHNARYARTINGQTPDWSIVTVDRSVVEIIDVITLHQRRETDIEIGRVIASGAPWVVWITIPPNHLLSKLEGKTNKYARLVEQSGIPYVIATFSEFTASIDPEEVAHVLHELYGGLFSKSAWLSGVLYFRERNGIYEFTSFRNPHASRQSVVLTDASSPLSRGDDA